jgi:hypothetical protein
MLSLFLSAGFADGAAAPDDTYITDTPLLGLLHGQVTPSRQTLTTTRSDRPPFTFFTGRSIAVTCASKTPEV